MRALRELGLDQDAIAIGAPIEQTEYRTYNGDMMAMWPVGEIAADHGIPDIGVNRRDLHRMLAEALPEGTVQLDKVLEDFTEESDGVHVRLGGRRRSPRLRAARRRRPALTRAREAARRGEAAARRLHAVADDDRRLRRPAASGRRAGHLRPRQPRDPALRGQRRAVLGRRAVRALNAADLRQDRKERLLAHFLEWRGAIAAAISRTPEEQIVGIDIYDRPAAKEWGRGRVTLAGDAAHPMTTNLSQGGCQALEDSVVLARHLSQGTDVNAALRAYESERIPRTDTRSVKRSRRVWTLGSWERPAAMAARTRDPGHRPPRGPGLKDHKKFVAAPLCFRRLVVRERLLRLGREAVDHRRREARAQGGCTGKLIAGGSFPGHPPRIRRGGGQRPPHPAQFAGPGRATVFARAATRPRRPSRRVLRAGAGAR